MIVIDTLRQDRLSGYGYGRRTSPNLDRLAAEGARVDGLAPTSWTKPSTASILTGLHPLRHQAIGRGDVLNEQATTLAEILAGEGYSTAGVSANVWVSNVWGLGQGFDRFELLKVLDDPAVGRADEITRRGQFLLRDLEPPFFIYLHYIDPHAPYDPPIDWNGDPLDPELARYAPMAIDSLQPLSFFERPADRVRAASDLYDGEVRYVDREIGKLLDDLELLGYRDDTVVVVTSDHGEEFEEHGRLSHGHTLFRETTQVPMIFRAPGTIPPGRRLSRRSVIDIAPTILDLVKIEVPDEAIFGLDGEVLTETLLSGEDDNELKRSADRKHILHVDFDDGKSMGLIWRQRKILLTKVPFLKAHFDLATDPLEQENLLMVEADRSDFDESAKALAETHNELTRAGLERVTTAIDDELARSIQALGYAAFAKQGNDRAIPRRIEAADAGRFGSLGWEMTTGFDRCVSFGLGNDERQLVSGWYQTAHPSGRWSQERASVDLGLPTDRADGWRLRIRGVNHRGVPYRLRLLNDGVTVFDRSVLPGWFDLDVPIPAVDVERISSRIEIISAPAFLPAQIGQLDQRSLGSYLYSICAEPSSSENRGVVVETGAHLAPDFAPEGA